MLVASLVGLLQPLPQHALDILLETVYIVATVTLITGERSERGTLTIPICAWTDAHEIARKSSELFEQFWDPYHFRYEPLKGPSKLRF